MLTITDSTIIYVHCPAGLVTGGAELLHQLVSFLRDNSRDARLVYFGDAKHKVPQDYLQYNILLADEVLDSQNNVEVFYEGIFHFIKADSKTQKFLWWISVDNFYRCEKSYLPIGDLLRWSIPVGLRELCRRLKSRNCHVFIPKERTSIKTLLGLNAVCGYQAEYIQHYLLDVGFMEVLPLKDYINLDHILPFKTSGREDIVVYNPQKGVRFTQKLISAANGIKFVPLIGMTREQLVATIRRAKVYIDFGEHPGKDRLPRECAMNGCCIITGKRGSAGFFEDVSIPYAYKFDEKDIKAIIDKIRELLINYDDALSDFDFYRRRISFEKDEFEEQIRSVFL